MARDNRGRFKAGASGNPGGRPRQARADVRSDGWYNTLTGIGTEPNGLAFTYLWTQIGGEPVTLNDATKAAASFTSPPQPATKSEPTTPSMV